MKILLLYACLVLVFLGMAIYSRWQTFRNRQAYLKNPDRGWPPLAYPLPPPPPAPRENAQ